MLAIGFRYLTGRAVATSVSARDRAEWPPHPARLFMALAATWFEDAGTPEERRALEWLEGLPAPLLRAPNAAVRDVVTHFVPVNDTSSPIKGKRTHMALQSMPLGRGRQERHFPSVTVGDEPVMLLWPEAAPAPEMLSALGSLCARVTRLGHSSSMVQVWIEERTGGIEPTHEPSEDDADAVLRVVRETEGTLTRLEDDFRHGLRPRMSTAQGYAAGRPPRGGARTGDFDPRLLILRLVPPRGGEPRLGPAATLRLTSVYHRAVLETFPDPVPEIVSGHRPDGRPSRRAHLSVFPLPFVGRPHADGHLLGLAVALPRGLESAERQSVLRHLGRIKELTLGRLGVWGLHPAHDDLAFNLRAETWTSGLRGAQRWASVTPVVLDRYPKGSEEKRDATVRETVARACERVGLPRPAAISVSRVPHAVGAPLVEELPPYRTKNGAVRPSVHVGLEFDESVRGPVILGAGRFRGYGLLRPWMRSERSS